MTRDGPVWRIALVVGLMLATAAQARPLNAVASFTVLADVVKQVGGAHVTVRSLVPPSGDPHEFEPTPDDARALKNADIAFVSGVGLEPWFGRLARAAGYKATPVSVSAGIPLLQMAEDGKTVPDPHVWNDPANVIRWTGVVADALAAADPEDAATYRANAARYIDRLRQADADARARIAAIPPDRRKILTSHESFAYFGKAYGVTFLAPVGVSTAIEPSAATVAKLIDQIRREKIKLYFFENSGDSRLVKQIGAATGATPGGTLYVESLSPPDGPAADYLAMFHGNVNKLVDAMSR